MDGWCKCQKFAQVQKVFRQSRGGKISQGLLSKKLSPLAYEASELQMLRYQANIQGKCH